MAAALELTTSRFCAVVHDRAPIVMGINKFYELIAEWPNQARIIDLPVFAIWAAQDIEYPMIGPIQMQIWPLM